MMQKGHPPCVRILVLGAEEVGKSAVTVRFLTQRFIGEYSSQKDLLYCSQTQVTGSPVDVEILDTSRDQTDSIPSEKLEWGSAFVYIYSVSSRASFQLAGECARKHQRTRPHCPALLLANKCDLEHAREVTSEEGHALARELGGVHFAEISAAEGGAEVCEAFRSVVSEAASNASPKSLSPTNTGTRRKISVVSVSKIISAVFGRIDQNGQKKRPSLSL